MCKYTPYFCDILHNLEQIERAIALSYPIARLFFDYFTPRESMQCASIKLVEFRWCGTL